ncbi:MAG: hypothetical protein Q8P70_00580 [bacterium]|nr:hypothetical protein [bacterium]
MRFFFWMFIIALVSMTGAFLLQPGGGYLHFPFGGFSWLVMSLVILAAAWRLYFKKADRKELGTQVKTFALSLACFAAFLFIMFLPHIPLFFTHNDHGFFSEQMNLAYILGHIFLYLSLAVFVRVPLSMTHPKYMMPGMVFFLILGAVTTIINFILPNAPEFHHASGLTLLGVDPLVGKLVAINVALAWVPAGAYFIWSGITALNTFVKRRGLLLGSGLLVATIGGPLHDIVASAPMFLTADLVTILGNLMVAAGIFMSPSLEDSRS